MADLSPEMRMLPGSTVPAAGSPGTPERSGEISFGQIFGVLRRRYRLVLLMAVLGAAVGAFLAIIEPATYRARAVIRLAQERRALTGPVEEPAPDVVRTTDPMLSLVQLVQSRSVISAVVDSLKLQLQPVTRGFRRSLLSHIAVDRRATSDSVMLDFAPNQVTAQLGMRRVIGAYGQVLPLGTVSFAVDRRPAMSHAVLTIYPREVAIDWLYGSLLVTARTSTDLIDVAFASTDPRLAQDVANTTVTLFQSLNIQAAKEKSRRRRIVLEEQLAQTDSTLARAQADLAGFRSRLQVGSSENKLAAEQSALLALDARRAELTVDRNTYTSLLGQLRSGDDRNRTDALRTLAGSPALADNPQVTSLYQRLTAYQFQLDSMTTGQFALTADNPDVKALRKRIELTQGELTQAVGAHINALDAKIGSLGALRQQSGQSIQVLPAVAQEELRLTSRVEALGRVGEQLRQDYQRARMAEEVEAGDVDIVDLADLPYAPLSGATAIKFGLGLVLGVLLGGCLAFLLEALNTSIRRPEDIESVLHVPGLAVIPRLEASPVRRGAIAAIRARKATLPRAPAGGALGTTTQPFSVGTEAFRMLRTSLVWSDGADRLRTLVVTSAAPGEGKTLTAANLAVSFAHDGLEVLLIDCDVRRPRLHGLFRTPRSPGLLDILSPPNGSDPVVGSLSFDPDHPNGGDPLQHVLRPTPIRGLTLLPCGALPTNASDLLSGVRMRSLLEELKRRFTLVVLDTPPVLATADAGIVGSLADGVLLVVRAGQTDRLAAQRAAQQLANVGAHVVGAVLNDPKGELSQYGEYYYPYEYVPEQ